MKAVVCVVAAAIAASFLVATGQPAGAAVGVVASVSDVSYVEGNTGPTARVSIPITLSSPATQDTYITYKTYKTLDLGSATGEDYNGRTETVRIRPGYTTAYGAVVIKKDTAYGPDEHFEVKITTTTPDVTIGDGTATITIVNDDPVPQLSLSSASVVEGTDSDPGLSTHIYFYLSAPVEHNIGVTVKTVDGTATAADLDYRVRTSQYVVVKSAVIPAVVNVRTNDDTKVEGNETFDVVVTSITDPTIPIADGVGTVTIIDND